MVTLLTLEILEPLTIRVEANKQDRAFFLVRIRGEHKTNWAAQTAGKKWPLHYIRFQEGFKSADVVANRPVRARIDKKYPYCSLQIDDPYEIQDVTIPKGTVFVVGFSVPDGPHNFVSLRMKPNKYGIYAVNCSTEEVEGLPKYIFPTREDFRSAVQGEMELIE